VSTALVTGATAGIGREFARALAARGHDLVLVARDAARLEGVAAELRDRHGIAAEVLSADLVGEEGLRAVEARLGDTEAPVDILVNNAGIPPEGIVIKRFVETGPDEWDPLIRLNLAAVLGVTRAYLPGMLDRGWGRILTIVSDAGRRGERNQAVYGAAKAAAMGFSRGLAAEVGRQGVTVNCISLGTMKTGALAEHIERDASIGERLARAYPAGRIGEVTDPAPLAVLLCSDAAEWITGQVYPVDGGYAPAL
jgi:NAD(P)-dependent dehydrogenase (short-subunit alcohol dehydrogenase family)